MFALWTSSWLITCASSACERGGNGTLTKCYLVFAHVWNRKLE
jgi:hypothetical protein